ncbi:NADH-quinone oxidoreductase subunit NuoN [Tahibacter amnicola]|uniref:NADH-quinone oxidoreductase subunit N n=1 Tax=Tahibacter amnicola TaxID=2976241 RepID=A0ABY6BL29_9GAMM|nr:NADH-quinone oxidoreductase subunit NuoN [Tahibacter amnicola]UXI69740.1 NADH-quinone oxidoreductase subunit NuoN [Tahibacter amnicola]
MISLTDILTLLPECFLTGAICVLLLLDVFLKPSQRDVTHYFSIAILAVTAWLVLSGPGAVTVTAGAAKSVTAFGGMFIRDGMADALKLFALLTSALVFVYARPYLRDRSLYVGEYYVLCLFAVLGMMFLVSAGSLVIVYLGLELLALSSYALVALNRDSRLSSEAAMKYFVLGALASGMLLYGMSLIYGAAHTLDLNGIREFAAVPVNAQSKLLLTGVVFVVVGIAFKFGAAPFHMWLPDVYQGAPTAVTVFIGSAPKLAAFGMAYRLLETGLDGAGPHWQQMLAVLAVASLAIGNIAAIMQSNLKRMLAYSTISHVGFLLLGLVNGQPGGYAAAMFYAISYALMAAAAFGMILLLSRAGFEAEEIDDFKGLNQRSPWHAFLMLLVMFSLAGVPPMFGFFGKLLVLKAAIDAHQIWLAVTGAVFAIVGIFYYLRVVKVMYFDDADDESRLPTPGDLPMRVTISMNALALLVLGFFWGPLYGWCVRSLGIY